MSIGLTAQGPEHKREDLPSTRARSVITPSKYEPTFQGPSLTASGDGAIEVPGLLGR